MTQITRNAGFRMDVRSVVCTTSGLRTDLNRKVTNAEIKTPWINSTIDPTDVERKSARKLIVWLKDRRVLSASECCDGCIKSSIESLLKIRGKLVDTQVELHDYADKGLFLLTEFMLVPVRQFLTWHEALQKKLNVKDEEHWPREAWDLYFEALNVLREHEKQCIAHVAIIADMPVVEMPDSLRPQFPDWSADAYQA